MVRSKNVVVLTGHALWVEIGRDTHVLIQRSGNQLQEQDVRVEVYFGEIPDKPTAILEARKGETK